MLHAPPHAPQLPALVLKSVSQPLEILPSQSPQPAVQAILHAPAKQLGVPFALLHAPAQPPQFATSEFRLISQPVVAMPSQFP